MKQQTNGRRGTSIQLRNIGKGVQSTQQLQNKVHIKPIPLGIELSMRPQKKIPPQYEKDEAEQLKMTALIVAMWAIGGLAGVFTIREGLVEWLCLWLSGTILGSYVVARAWYRRVKIVLVENMLTIGTYVFGVSWLKIGRETSYDIRKMTDVRLASPEKWNDGKLWFGYGTETITECKNIGMMTAKELVNILSDILRFRCHMIECILFGVYQYVGDKPQVLLQNPDVSEMTFPFIRLKRVIIQTETCDFYQIERFITYAVNYLGQEFLKHHVDVYLYGTPEKLHANLRNNLTNLCRSVYEHE